MQPRRSALSLSLALLAGAGCNKNNPPSAPPAAARDASAAPSDGGAVAVDTSPLTPPADALFVVRGASLKNVITIVAPGAPTRAVLSQVAPQYSPGIGEHGLDVDPEKPFAIAAIPVATGERARLGLHIAWPLRAGAQIAQDAAAGHNYREVAPGLYESTAAPEPGDAGVAAAENPCWVARKQPVGWALVCGPRATLRTAANFLVRAASRAPEGDPVLDITLRPEAARPMLAAQMRGLEAQDPRHSGVDAGAMQSALIAQYDQVHRTAVTYKEIADDLRTFHATLTLDENSYHVRAEADFANATAASTRALLASTVGRRTAAELLARLPTTASSYLTMSVDGAAMAPLLGSADDEEDPRMAAAVGPEFMRFQHLLRDLTAVRNAGERAIGFMTDDGGTRIEVMRMADPVAALNAVRAAAASVPRTPRASGLNPSEQFAVLPSPAGLPAGSLRLRLNPDPARLPPNAPPEARRMYQRTTLLVPEGDKLYLIESADPVARWTALGTGTRIAVTVPENHAGVAHLSPMALLMLLGVPATQEIQAQAAGEPIDGALTARRVGDAGAHFELRVDAPIVSLNRAREVVATLQAQQAQSMQQAQEAQQRAMQQAQAAARRAQQGARANPGMVLPTPSSPDELPAPNFQLNGPR